MAKQSTARSPELEQVSALEAWRRDLLTAAESLMLETSISSRDPNGKTFQEPATAFPVNAILKFWRYGFQRVFNDATGGSDSTVEQKVAEAAEMIERFKAGDIGRQSTVGVDTVTSLARSLARQGLKKSNPAQAKQVRELIKNGGEDRERAWRFVDAIIAKNPSLIDDAKAELARKAEVADSIDTSGVEL